MNPSTMEIAKRYLDGNRAIRDALGIPSNVALAPVPLAQGEHNANFILELAEPSAKCVLRINFESQLNLEKQASYEARALEALKPSGRTPGLLYVDDSKERIDHGVLVIDFMEGRHLDFTRAGDIEEAARILADIHSVRPSKDCGLIRPSDPLRAQFDTCLEFFERYCSSKFADATVASWVERLVDRAGLFLSGGASLDDAWHIQNTEAVPSHFLIPEEGCGHMIDWEKPIVGEAAQDVAYFMSPTTTIWDTDYLFEPPARERFLDAYWNAVGGRFQKGSFDERYPAFVMVNALLGITWSCNAVVDYRGSSKVLRNTKTERLLGVYLSEDFLQKVWVDCFERLGR